MQTIWGESPRSLISLRGIHLNTAMQPSGALRKSPSGCGDPGPRNGRPLLVTGQGGLTVGAVPSRGRGEGAKQRPREREPFVFLLLGMRY